MKKQVKIYLHEKHFQPISLKIKDSFLNRLFYLIEKTCYLAGMVLISILTAPFMLIKSLFTKSQQSTDDHRSHHQDSFLSRIKYQKQAIISFSIIVIIVSLLVQSLSAIADGQSVKGRVLGVSDEGLKYLETAQHNLENQDLDTAQANFTKALTSFQNSQVILNSTGLFLKGVMGVIPQKQDADALLQSAQLLTQAGLQGSNLLKRIDNLKLGAIGLNINGDTKHNRNELQSIKESITEIVNIAQQAIQSLNSVSINSIPQEYQSQFISAKNLAQSFQKNTVILNEGVSLLFDLLLGQKNTLVLLQNNNELRATGGFIGTIGSAKLEDGSINYLNIKSVYDYDGQLKEKILPPQPIFAVNDRLFLRDSNWFVNFPESAKIISNFFEKEGGETPDLIIAITPEIILNMLERTGPITLAKQNITLSKENFIEQTQIETSLNYDKSLNQPKQFLADFFPILMQKLADSGGLMSFLDIIQSNLTNKNILLYSRNPDLETSINKFNWGGEVKETDRDYLSINSSNLGGTKTDASIQRTANLKTAIASNGTITNTLELTVNNPNFDTQLFNKSFIRVLVPKGSKLLASSGFSNDVKLPSVSENNYQPDSRIMAWQNQVSQNTTSGIYTGQEAGKTWFGNWINLPANTSRTIQLTYELPFKLSALDRYSLLVQKQSGMTNLHIDTEIDFTGRRSLWNTIGSQIDDGTLKYSSAITTDTLIGFVSEKIQ